MARRAALTARDDRLLRRFRRLYLPRIRKEFEPAEVWVFGSRVRGDAMEESDLDTIIVAEAFAGIPWPDRTVRVLRAAGITDAIEILCYTPAEFREKRGELGIVNAAVSEGRRIHPRSR